MWVLWVLWEQVGVPRIVELVGDRQRLLALLLWVRVR
jgi:hypothetical protein